MVRAKFIKELQGKTITILDEIWDFICYNNLVCFIRHIFRFLRRLPKWLKLCWNTENWDFEGMYDFLEMFLKDLLKAQEEDTWHVEHETKRRALQIKCTLAHLDRYRNWPDYYEWPESHTEKSTYDEKYGQLYTLVYDDPDADEKIEYVHKMETKHYNKFWDMLRKYHQGWWT